MQWLGKFGMSIEVAEIKQVTSVQPSQWVGRLVDGRPLYIRYKWGELSISLGTAGTSIDSAVGGEPWFRDEVGEKMGAMLTLEEVCSYSGLRIPSERLRTS